MTSLDENADRSTWPGFLGEYFRGIFSIRLALSIMSGASGSWAKIGKGLATLLFILYSTLSFL